MKGKNYLEHLVCKVSKKKPIDMIPWLSLDIQRQLLHHEQTFTGFLKRSRQSRLNKITGHKAGTHHAQGLASVAPIAKKMVSICLFSLCFEYVRLYMPYMCAYIIL